MESDKIEASVPFLTSDQDDGENFFADRKTHKEPIRGYSLVIASCFLLSIILTFISTFVFTNWTWTRNVDNFCALHTSQSWSPVMNDIDIKYKTVLFNGSFFKNTIYRQPPSPEVDRAWRDLGIDYAGIIVPPLQAQKSNIQSNRVIFNETYGGPGYPAIFEVFHQLHCLDVLRKSTYFNYEYYLKLGQGPFKHPKTQLEPHVGHCIDVIRQQLMCTADTGVHPFILVGNPPLVFPDFNREHKCKNFDDIRAWAEEHQGDFDEEARFHTPLEGELILDEAP